MNKHVHMAKGWPKFLAAQSPRATAQIRIHRAIAVDLTPRDTSARARPLPIPPRLLSVPSLPPQTSSIPEFHVTNTQPPLLPEKKFTPGVSGEMYIFIQSNNFALTRWKTSRTPVYRIARSRDSLTFKTSRDKFANWSYLFQNANRISWCPFLEVLAGLAEQRLRHRPDSISPARKNAPRARRSLPGFFVVGARRA